MVISFKHRTCFHGLTKSDKLPRNLVQKVRFQSGGRVRIMNEECSKSSGFQPFVGSDIQSSKCFGDERSRKTCAAYLRGGAILSAGVEAGVIQLRVVADTAIMG